MYSRYGWLWGNKVAKSEQVDCVRTFLSSLVLTPFFRHSKILVQIDMIFQK